MHVVIMGCGRVGSPSPTSSGLGHSVAVIDRDPDAFRRLSADFGGQQGHRRRLRPRHAASRPASSEAHAFAAVSSGDNSNIIAARVARETFGVENVVARIYDPRRAEVYQRLGIPTVATVRWTADQVLRRLLPEGPRHRVARPERRASCWPRSHVARRWVGAARHAARGGGRRAGRASSPGSARGCCRTATAVVQEGDLVHVTVRCGRGCDEVERRPRRRPDGGGALMRVAIAGAGNVGRSIARELLEQRPRGAAHRARAARHQGRHASPSAEWLLADACELDDARARPACRRATWSSPPPVTTRSTWSCRCWPRPSSACPRRRPRQPPEERVAVQRGVGRRRRGVDAAPARRRWSRRPSAVGDLVRLLTFKQGGANLVELTLADDAPLVGKRDRRRAVAQRQRARGGPARGPGRACRRRTRRSRPATSCCSSRRPRSRASSTCCSAATPRASARLS